MIAQADCARCGRPFRYERGKGPPRRYHAECAYLQRLDIAAAIKRRNRREPRPVILCVYCKKPVPNPSRKGGRPPKQHYECGLREKQRKEREKYAKRKAAK